MIYFLALTLLTFTVCSIEDGDPNILLYLLYVIVAIVVAILDAWLTYKVLHVCFGQNDPIGSSCCWGFVTFIVALFLLIAYVPIHSVTQKHATLPAITTHSSSNNTSLVEDSSVMSNINDTLRVFYGVLVISAW